MDKSMEGAKAEGRDDGAGEGRSELGVDIGLASDGGVAWRWRFMRREAKKAARRGLEEIFLPFIELGRRVYFSI